MNYLKSKLNTPLILQILIGLYLCIYLVSGVLYRVTIYHVETSS